jgi:hypothetical protein
MISERDMKEVELIVKKPANLASFLYYLGNNRF